MELTGSLCAGGGNLLAEIGGRHDLLGQRDAIVLQEDETQLVAHVHVIVDATRQVVEELDDLLGHVVARCRLPAQHNCPRRERRTRVELDPGKCQFIHYVIFLILTYLNSALDLRIIV